MFDTTLMSSWPARAASSWIRTDCASASSLAWWRRIVRRAIPTTGAAASSSFKWAGRNLPPSSRIADLAFVGCAGHAHLQYVKRLEPRALGLRFGEVVGVGEGQTDVRGHVLQQLHVPVVERGLVVRLQRKHGGDPVAAQDGHPDERA